MANKDIKKVAVSKDKYEKIKYLTTWLFNPNKPLNLLIEDPKEFNSNLKYRLFNNVLNNPKLCAYLDQYLNNLYDFHSDKYSPEQWLRTFADIIRISKVKSFHFSKYQNLKRNQFTKLLDDYLDLCDYQNLNQEEINNLFLLFEHNILTQENIENIQAIIAGKDNNKEVKINKSQFVNIPSQPSIKSADIVNFCNIVNKNIINRNTCKSCAGYQKGNIIIDTNVSEIKPVDINVICNISPTKEDIKSQTFLAENIDFKNYLIELFNKFNLTFTFTNKVLCYNNLTEPAAIKKVVSTCSGIIGSVNQSFNATLNIVLGAKVAKELGIKSFTKQIGMLINNKYFLLNHPNEINAKNLNVSKQFESLISLLSKQNYKSTIIKEQPTVDKNILISDKIINNYTLFDIQIIGNKVVYIVLDSNNNKEYIVNEFNFPIYIKYGNFKECNYISDKVDFVAYVSAYEKRSIQDKLLLNLKSNILKQAGLSTVSEMEEENEIQTFDQMFEENDNANTNF